MGFPRGSTPAVRPSPPHWPRAGCAGALGRWDWGSENAGMKIICLLYFTWYVLLVAQNVPLRWALGERAIIPLPRLNNASSTIEGADRYSVIALSTYSLYVQHCDRYYKGASRRAALAARRFARRLHAMSSAVVVFAFLPAGCLMFFPTRTLTASSSCHSFFVYLLPQFC